LWPHAYGDWVNLTASILPELSIMSNPSPAAAATTAAIRKMGQAFNEEILAATYAIYKPLQERAPKDGVTVHKDLAYGEDARHRLDIFVPAKKPAAAPVIVYVHGGGYVAGARSPLPGLIYDNVPTFFARHGCIGVNATYRLAPAHKWPAGAADMGAAVAWLRANIAAYGGDPSKIFLMGQSAGASHVATWTFLDRVHGSAGPGIAGAILLSGGYAALHPQFHSGPSAPNHIAYFGEDTASWNEKCVLGNVKAGHPRVFVGVAELDPYPLTWPSAALVAELVQRDKRIPWFRMMRGHNHVSPAMQINSEVDTLGPELLEFVLEGVS
jgi:acetyl esterase